MMQMQQFLHNIKHVVALHVGDALAARDGHDLALDSEQGCAVGELDAEAVAREGHDFFF